MTQTPDRSEARFRVLFEAANDGILLTRGTTLESCNRRALDFIGLRWSEVAGRDPAQFSPEYQPDGQRSIEKAAVFVSAALDGTPQLFEWTALRADGSLLHTEVSLQVLEPGEPPLFLSIIRDIGVRKRTELELRRQADELRAFNDAMTDRESRIIELKEQVNRLSTELGRDVPYPAIWDDSADSGSAAGQAEDDA